MKSRVCAVLTMLALLAVEPLCSQGQPDDRPGDRPDRPEGHPVTDAESDLEAVDEACTIDRANGVARLKENRGRSAIHVLIRHVPQGATYDVELCRDDETESLGTITVPSGNKGGFGQDRDPRIPRCAQATLSGAEEVPPVETDASGSAKVVLSGRDLGDLRYQIIVNGLSGPATGAHIHAAPAGENGGVLIPLDHETLRGSIELDDVQRAAISDAIGLGGGDFYVNIHTEANPTGEIRGQLSFCSDAESDNGDSDGDNDREERARMGNGLLRVDTERGDTLPLGAQSVAELAGATIKVSNGDGCVILSGEVATVERGGNGGRPDDGDGEGDGEGDGGGEGDGAAASLTLPVFEEFLFDVTERHDASFRRGDSNEDWTVDVSDAMHTLAFLFSDVELPTCPDAADSNDDGIVDVSDPLASLSMLFLGGPALPAPGLVAGFDPTADNLLCEEF